MAKQIDELGKLRHTAEHVLHTAMQNLYPSLKKAMGPAIEDGFYFDFDLKDKVSEADFPKIEKEMKRLIGLDLKMVHEHISIVGAEKIFKKNPYKMDWINQISKRGEKVSIYKMVDHKGKVYDLDLCSGPHADSTGEVKAFKLLSIAGAYWHGDEKNKMLTRIYGTCFPTQKGLDEHLWRMEEAKKRDHRKLGKELDLFVISEVIGKGLPLLTPKGAAIRKQVLDYEYSLESEAGFLHVVTPHIARSEIYKKTGHWQHYRDMMYAPFGIDDEDYVLKPMNCPHHYMIYASRPRSYKDLPMRITEPGTCYRFEKSGELAGLLRVRALTIDDSHILMSEDQIESEFKLCIGLVKKMFQAFHLNNFYVRLSLSDPSDAIKYIADTAVWEKACKKLEKIVKENQLDYKIAKGEASFYGPKIDFMVRDSIGREWQMSTLQLDLFMGKKLNLIYVDENGKEQHPVIIHRGLTGSIERTLAVLIEHFAGAFPLWLAPVQVMILPVSDRFQQYALKIKEKLGQGNIRVELNNDNKTLGAKIRESTLQKVPYMVIIGEKESVHDNELYVSVRTREGKDLGLQSVENFINTLKEHIEKFQ